MGKTQNFKRHGSRYKSRLRAAQLLFEAEMRDVDPVELAQERQGLASEANSNYKPVSSYTSDIVDGVATHLDAVDEVIATSLDTDWTFDRLAAVDRSVLRVAAWEILFNDEIPPRVSVVEAVEIGSQLGQDDSSRFLNGILDAVAEKKLRTENLHTTIVVSPVSNQPITDQPAVDQREPVQPDVDAVSEDAES